MSNKLTVPSEDYELDINVPGDEATESDCPLLTSWRLWTIFLVMVGTLQLMLGRMSLSMALVCMASPSPGTTDYNSDSGSAWDSSLMPNSSNFTNIEPSQSPQAFVSLDLLLEDDNATVHQIHGDFNWSKTIQGHLLSSYFYGYTVGMLLGGWACDRWGGRFLMLFSLGMNAGTNLLLPSAAHAHYGALLTIRVIQGFTEALGLNTHPYLLTRWGSQRDLSFLTSIVYSGFPLGVMVAHPLISTLCLHGPLGGWPSSFYVMGLMSASFTLTCAVLLHNSPSTHPFISETELRYFHRYGKELDPEVVSRPAPLLMLARSVPVYALLATSFFSTFGYQIFTLHQPVFMRDTFGFSIDQNGLMSSLPWALELPMSPAVGLVVDALKHKMTLTRIKKVFNTLGLILAGMTPVLVVEAPYEWRWLAASTLLLVVVGNCMMFVGGYFYTPIDLAPSFAATLSGMINIFTGINGLLAPILVAHMTPTGSRNEWRKVFWVSAAIHLLGIFTFLIWGSAETLPWATNTNILSKRTSLKDLDETNETSANMLTCNDKSIIEDNASDSE
ncbi:uncharacterized transporter slc-17.2-like [Panulirus ornatus]|uniref:uncharacterized transporter slc-17.2-like n=1 Tax=Panulirus ornatus TaxID=150431 RepID=UPI003A8A7596